MGASLFFTAAMIRARIIAAVKNIDAICIYIYSIYMASIFFTAAMIYIYIYIYIYI
jgi:hypothetical protein